MNAQAVYVDFDDVLCETAQVLLGVVEREFGRRYSFEDIHSFDLEASFELSASEYKYMMGLIHDPEMLRIMQPMPGVADVLQKWATHNIHTMVVTGRPPETAAVCHEWLDNHAIPYEQVLFVDKYGRTPSHQIGVDVIVPEALKEIEFAMAVEDAPAMIHFLLDQTDIPLAVLDRPWNRSLDLSQGARQGVRCRDWRAVAQTFNAHARCSAG